MEILLVGAGVIGTVYGAQLAAAGHTISVLAHGSRTDEVARLGLVTRDVDGISQVTAARVVSDAGAFPYDLVVVAVWADHIRSATESLRTLSGEPALFFFGNNPEGRSAIDLESRGTVHLGFPGIGGSMHDGAAVYARIAQQPTTLEAGGGRAIEAFASALSQQGFAVTRTADMDGWLAYHAVFVATIAAALYRCEGSAVVLANESALLTLVCRAIEEGFRALRHNGVRGLPRNLRILHLRALRPFAARYWSRTMRSPMGERSFAAHARHAEPEMRALAIAVLERVGAVPATDHLRRLLTPV